MPIISASGWCLLVLAAVIIGMSKTGFTGVGILAIPLVAMVIPARQSTGLILPMLLLGDVMAVAVYRRHAVWKHLVKLMPCAVVGIVIGFSVLGMVQGKDSRPVVDDAHLKPFIGAVILILLILNQWRTWRLTRSGDMHLPEGWWFAIIMGTLAGILTMMANAAGPIVVMYLLAMRLPKTEFIGTGAWYFLLLNAFKIPFSRNLVDDNGNPLITLESLSLNARVAPVIVLGGLLGLWLVKYIPEKPFTRIMQALAAAAAAQLLLGGLLTGHAASPAKRPAPASLVTPAAEKAVLGPADKVDLCGIARNA